MTLQTRPFAVVTGASSGIGFELAKCCAENQFDTLITADEPQIHGAVAKLRTTGTPVHGVEADLSTIEGVDRLYAATKGRPVTALVASAGGGLGRAFLDQDFDEARRIIDTNVTGTLYLLQKIGRDMRSRGEGRILIAGGMAGFTHGTDQAVYNGTRALLDSFAFALRAELKDSGVTVTCLMPGATAPECPKPADEVAKLGFEAMMSGEGNVVPGWGNKVRAASANGLPSGLRGEQHRKGAEPGPGSRAEGRAGMSLTDLPSTSQ